VEPALQYFYSPCVSQHDFTRKSSTPTCTTFTVKIKIPVRRQSAADSLTPVFGVWNKQAVAGDSSITENSVGEFAKLRKAAIGFSIEQFGYHWTDFHGIWCLNTFLISVEKIQVSLNLTRVAGALY
jgi:hypothetical protein